MLNNQSEIAIIGGGVVGLSIAIGLLQSGHKIIVYDVQNIIGNLYFLLNPCVSFIIIKENVLFI